MAPRGFSKLLGRRLARLRQAADLTLEAACKQLRWSTSKLNRIEGGQLPDIHGLRAMLDLYGVTADRWSEYVDIFDEAERQPGWWRAYGLDARGYVALEDEAVLVRDFTLAYVPGLLQTEAYARALFRAGARRSAQRLQKQVEIRMMRQRRLTSDGNPLELIAVMAESALHIPVGGRKVMYEQLSHLIMLSELDTVTLQVLPTSAGAHSCMDSVLTLLSFGSPQDPDVVYVEHALGSTTSAKDEAVNAATLQFRQLLDTALSPADSVALIERRLADR